MTTVALALGSNLGERDRFLASARTLLQAGGLLRVTAASPLYETEPVGGPAQPDYLNQVVLAEWGGTPEELLQLTSAVEIALGRTRDVPLGPRTLDVDLLFAGEAVRDTPALTLPHPALHRRRFVLVPLCDVAPDWVHPRLGCTVREMLDACEDTSRVDRWGGRGTKD